MLLVVGLGNPGPRYANNRHNVGFLALDAIRARHGFSRSRARFESEASDGMIGGERVLALKPQTYMNESGRAVGAALRFHRLDPAEVIVLHDEIDLAPGKVRAKRGGGAAGHKGLRSIASHIGPDFRRVRLGIGHPGKERVLGHVLRDFAAGDRAWVAAMTDAVAEAFPLLVAGDDPGFMTRVALIAPPPTPEDGAAGAADAGREGPPGTR